MQRKYEVPPGGELHVRMPLGDSRGNLVPPITLTLTQVEHEKDKERTAEIAGAALVVGIPCVFEAGASASVYSPPGCTITAEGPLDLLNSSLYVDSLGAAFHATLVDLHLSLAVQRRKAKQDGGRVGPCVLVCGAEVDSGKSTITRTLANYAVCLGYQPLYVDMDVTNPAVGTPGCLSVMCLQYPLDEEHRALCVPSQSIFIGSSGNSSMFRSGVGCAMALVEHRWTQGDRMLLGGLFADYPTLDATDDEALDQLIHTIEQCCIDTLVIVGASALKHKLLAAYDVGSKGRSESVLTLSNGQEVTLVVIEKAVGAVKRNALVKGSILSKFWDTYFYGSRLIPITPTEFVVQHNSIRVLRIIAAGGDRSLQTMMSLDNTEEPEMMTVMRLNPAGVQPGTLLALAESCFEVCNGIDPYHSEATFTPLDDEEVYNNLRASRRVLGFVKVISATSHTITLLTSCGALPQPQGCCFIACDEE